METFWVGTVFGAADLGGAEKAACPHSNAARAAIKGRFVMRRQWHMRAPCQGGKCKAA